MNDLNPRALANPQNLGLNPNPAFAAFRVNDSMVNIITASNPDKNLDPEKGRKPTLDDAPPPQQTTAISAKQQRATQRLAANFGQSTKKKMSTTGPTASGGVSLSKGKGDGKPQDRRKRPEGNFKKTPSPGGGPTDRRRT